MSAGSICPFLPEPDTGMNHDCLTSRKSGDLADYYFTALKYGNYLWKQGHAGRAILAVTKALYTELPATNPVYADWPLPYAALKWIIANHESDDFPGNPRVSFQHQASRMKPQHSDTKRARAWAVWALVCIAKPSLPGDPSESIVEPKHSEIETLLRTHGHPEEAVLWKQLAR
ncbi:MAG: hypothetical protein ACPGKS_05535 [Coraliomargarita sp.]